VGKRIRLCRVCGVYGEGNRYNIVMDHRRLVVVNGVNSYPTTDDDFDRYVCTDFVSAILDFKRIYAGITEELYLCFYYMAGKWMAFALVAK